MMLAHTCVIGGGRAYLTDARNVKLIASNYIIAGACYSYAPMHPDAGIFRDDNMRHFSQRVVEGG